MLRLAQHDKQKRQNAPAAVILMPLLRQKNLVFGYEQQAVETCPLELQF